MIWQTKRPHSTEYITFNLDDGIYDTCSIQYTADMAAMILGDNYHKDSETLDGFHCQIEKLRDLMDFLTRLKSHGS